MESKFDKLESNLDKKFSAIQASIAGNPPPSPAGTGPTVAASSGDGARPSYAAVAATPAHFMFEDVTTPSFNRKPNPSILYCNVHDKTEASKKAFAESVCKLVFEAGLKDIDFSVLGDELDFRFELQFTGDLRTGPCKALQIYQSLQLGRGKRKVH